MQRHREEQTGLGTKTDMSSIVIILGSAPDALGAKEWTLPENAVLVAINNAWKLRPDWDYLIHSGDFPAERRPKDLNPGQQVHSHQSYVPAQNRYGGFVYAGGTMAFTAGYWTLAELKPDAMAFVGCDMVYSGRKTHFYGKGVADPLRDDITLQSLEAKSARLMALAAREGCACVNLSGQPESRLVFPRCTLGQLAEIASPSHVNDVAAEKALNAEDELGYMVESGEYWKHLEKFDGEALSRIDSLWLTAIQPEQC